MIVIHIKQIVRMNQIRCPSHELWLNVEHFQFYAKDALKTKYRLIYVGDLIRYFYMTPPIEWLIFQKHTEIVSVKKRYDSLHWRHPCFDYINTKEIEQRICVKCEHSFDTRRSRGYHQPHCVNFKQEPTFVWTYGILSREHGISYIFWNICDMSDTIITISLWNQPCISILLQIRSLLFDCIDKLNHFDTTNAIPAMWCQKFIVSNTFAKKIHKIYWVVACQVTERANYTKNPQDSVSIAQNENNKLKIF